MHEAVRKSELLVTLNEKLSTQPSGGFALASELGKLRDVIAPQIGDTRILFPEFTPHDEPLHVAKLFQLADKFFGFRIYRELNGPELFLLAAALYAHDWGMAIGQDEKEYLRSGAIEDRLRGTFAPLPDENERLNAYIRSIGLQISATGEFPELSDHHLRSYVRDTHARRSGARVRAHFVECPAVGEALARLCEGHWHDFATLDDPERFPREYEVAGDTANLLALTLQVRLVDLFHITDDRTPFALWRFVSPSDDRSAEEWKKHRALHGVAVVDFPPGRAIKVQGFTEDEEVWAGLQDLRRYCEDQIKRSLDVCARHVPQRYGLDFLRLEWAVQTGHLRPVDFRFEFDRTAMFRILSDDIYDGDRYVFLRELLQNAIDAIRTRRARQLQRNTGSLRKKQMTPTFDTTIYFIVEHLANGDINLSCRDHGIGMDEHIIRNYFTVAGVSYYRSSEFERHHLGFEPISRFGIGILSCFMVADELEVKTYRDPECGPAIAHADAQLPSVEEYRARRLRLEVPGIQRQFVVKDLIEDFAVGTEVRLKVLKGKVEDVPTQSELNVPPSGSAASSNSPLPFKRTLKVTEYLSKIAGFVEFPILVVERWPGNDQNDRTLILHPNCDSAIERDQFDGAIQVHQLSRSYPWDEVIAPSDVSAAREVMSEQMFDLREVAVDRGYEGWIVFPKPKNEDWDFSASENRIGMGGCHTYWKSRDGTNTLPPPLHWTKSSFDESEDGSLNLLSVYRDGILLTDIKSVKSYESHGSPFPPPLIRVNLLAATGPAPNVARTSFSVKKSPWDKPIVEGVERLVSKVVASTLELPLVERFFRLGWLAVVFHLKSEVLTRLVPADKLVTVWLNSNGSLELREGNLNSGDEVPLVPNELDRLIEPYAAKLLCAGVDNSASSFAWEGPASLVMSLRSYFSAPLSAATNWSNHSVRKCIVHSRLQFLHPPNGIGTLLSQVVAVVHAPMINDEDEDEGDESITGEEERVKRIQWLRKKDVSHSLQIAASNPGELELIQCKLVAIAFGKIGMEDNMLMPIIFSRPFSECGLNGEDRINMLHPFGADLTRCLAACAIAERDGVDTRELRAAFHRISNARINSLWNESPLGSDLSKIACAMFDIVIKHNLINGFIAPEIPQDDERVPNIPGLPSFKMPIGFLSLFERGYDPNSVNGPFGKLICEVPGR